MAETLNLLEIDVAPGEGEREGAEAAAALCRAGQTIGSRKIVTNDDGVIVARYTFYTATTSVLSNGFYRVIR